MFALIAPELREGCYPSLIQGFDEACKDYQHQTLVGNSANEVSRQGDLILQMIDQSIGGVAIVPTTKHEMPAYHARQLQKHQIPIVFCHRTITGVAAPAVIFSGQETGYKAAMMALRAGHTRMAILSAHRYAMVEERIQGMRDAFAEEGADPKGVVVEEFDILRQANEVSSAPSIKRAVDRLLSMSEPPTAIFCGNAPDAEAVYLHVKSRGLQIPRDLSLLYFGTMWREHGLASLITALAVDEHNIGACAAKLLHEMRTGVRPIDNDERILFPVTELSGETFGIAPAR